jgi:hypothetical protein
MVSSGMLRRVALVRTDVVPSSPILVTLMKEALNSSETTFGVKNILQFVMNNLHSNIINIMSYRSDLPMSSCVNKEVSLFNKKIDKCCKSFNGVSLIRANCSIEKFTRHGIHLNSLGIGNVNAVK